MIVSQSFGKIKKERRAYLEQIGSGKYRGAIWKYGLSYCNDSLCGKKEDAEFGHRPGAHRGLHGGAEAG